MNKSDINREIILADLLYTYMQEHDRKIPDMVFSLCTFIANLYPAESDEEDARVLGAIMSKICNRIFELKKETEK